MQKSLTAGSRIKQLGAILEQAWQMQHDYEKRVKKLLAQMQGNISSWLESRPNEYLQAVELLKQFETYKSTTKREWISEKRELESLLGNIITKLRTYNLKIYQPPEGLRTEVFVSNDLLMNAYCN
jgi:hypothetical protein